MRIRLLALDIDGTLLDSHGQIPDDNRRAIGAALDRGIEVALVTGRAFHFARPIGERLGLPVVFVSSNGAVVKQADGTSLLRRLLPAATARDVLAATADHRGDAAVVFDRVDDRQVVAGGMDWQHPSRVGYWTRNTAIIAEVHPLEDCLDQDPIQVMFNGPVARMRPLAGRLRAESRGRYHVTDDRVRGTGFRAGGRARRGCQQGYDPGALVHRSRLHRRRGLRRGRQLQRSRDAGVRGCRRS